MNMNIIAVGVPIAVVLFVLLLWILNPPKHRADSSNRFPVDTRVEKLLPVHYQYFPQIRQALSPSDDQYLRERAPAAEAKEALRTRRKVARRFLSSLREDFVNLERLARMIAAFSPVVSRQQEMERVVLGLKFRVLYAQVWLRLSVGRVPVENMEHLTGLVGKLAMRMEQAMAVIGGQTLGERMTRVSA
jgi:hypothetical protein